MQKKGDREEKDIYKKKNVKLDFLYFVIFRHMVAKKIHNSPSRWIISKKISQMHASILAAQCFTTLLRFKLVFSFARDIRLETS